MLDLITWREDGPVFHYPFGRSGLEDEVWEHTAVIAPLAACYDVALLPLSRERGSDLTAEEVLRAAVRWVQTTQAPAGGIDWLGLALYAVQRHRAALAQLSARPREEGQADCQTTAKFADLLEEVYEKVLRAIHTEFGFTA
jgi:hypothetical protein